MNILITGGQGYIAKSLYNSLKDIYNITSLSITDFDLRDSKKTNEFFKEKYFDVVIHCAISGASKLKVDNWEVLDNNLKMYYNLLANSNNFSKFINFGSGAELFFQNTPYGITKHVIRQSILQNENFYNLRIYGVFDENELDSRFIKANIKRYINKEPMVVFENKLMSFFYMKDLIEIVKYYIENNNLQKEIDCCYEEIHSLYEIVIMINSLGNHTVEITGNIDKFGNDYFGNNLIIENINYDGFKVGLNNVYNKLNKND
jgi:dTDP-4-dehydrorhamnose reductase